METEADGFRRLGQELHVLECDLAECLNEFKQAYQVLYRQAESLTLKKFSIVYHTDNFYVRAHKLIEDVYALLALAVGIDPKKRTGPGEPSRRKQVRQALDAQKRELLRGLERDRLIRGAVEARNMFVHLYRDEPRAGSDPEWRWAMLAPVSRLRDFEGDPNEMGAELRRIAEPPHLDDYADRKTRELLETLQTIKAFRDRLYGELLDDVAQVVSARSPETRQRFSGLLEWANFWRSLGESVAE